MNVEQIAVIIAEGHKRVNDMSYIEMLKDLVKSYTNAIIRQTLTNNPDERHYFLMDCNYDLIEVPSFERLYDKGETILRTKDKIVKPLRIGEFDYVGTPDMLYGFGKADNFSLGLSLKYSHRQDNVYYRYIDDYIYIYGNDSIPLPSCGLIYIPESPIELLSYKTGEPVENIDYQIRDDIAQKVIQAITVDKARTMLPKVNNPEEVTINKDV